jgi:hypothetical protein
MINWFMDFAERAILAVFFSMIFSNCSLLERSEYDFTVQQVNDRELVVDFTKINPGSWDTLLVLKQYIQAEQIGIGYLDSKFLASHAGTDNYVVVGFLEKGNLVGYTLASGRAYFSQLFSEQDSIPVKKIPRSVAVFSFIKHEDGVYRLKK